MLLLAILLRRIGVTRALSEQSRGHPMVDLLPLVPGIRQFICSPTNGQHIYTYRGHAKMVNAIAWFPDSRRIASGSRDKEVHIWDSSSSKAIFTYSGHTEAVNALACSYDGQRIASASDDRTVQVWQAQ